MRRAAALVAAAFALASVAPMAGPARAEPPATESPAAPEPDPETLHKEYWQKRQAELERAVEDARLRLERAEAEYSRGRRANRLRGQAKVEVLQEIEDAKQDLAAAEAALDAFPEEARRAGVPPGWLR